MNDVKIIIAKNGYIVERPRYFEGEYDKAVESLSSRSSLRINSTIQIVCLNIDHVIKEIKEMDKAHLDSRTASQISGNIKQ